MKKWFILCVIAVLLVMIGGCSMPADEVESSTNAEEVYLTEEEETEEILELDSIEYWDIVHGEIISMLNQHNLYVCYVSNAYPCVQITVEPGVVTEDGKTVASGLTQEEYEELIRCVKEDLHVILDRYKLVEPKTAFHGCHSILDIYFKNWVIDENKVYDNVYSRDVGCYGLDLLEYYHEHEEDSYIKKDSFHASVWEKYPTYIP